MIPGSGSGPEAVCRPRVLAEEEAGHPEEQPSTIRGACLQRGFPGPFQKKPAGGGGAPSILRTLGPGSSHCRWAGAWSIEVATLWQWRQVGAQLPPESPGQSRLCQPPVSRNPPSSRFTRPQMSNGTACSEGAGSPHRFLDQCQVTHPSVEDQALLQPNSKSQPGQQPGLATAEISASSRAKCVGVAVPTCSQLANSLASTKIRHIPEDTRNSAMWHLGSNMLRDSGMWPVAPVWRVHDYLSSQRRAELVDWAFHLTRAM